jgi:cobalt-zinc-cadmium efflux system protein
MTDPSPSGHAFTHQPDEPRDAQRRALGWALGVNAGLLVVESIGGWLFHSLALLADAAHLVSDVAGLAIALLAVLLAARPVSARHSFGFARAEVLAAQASMLLLFIAGGWILITAVNRVRHPVAVNGAGLAAIAAIGLAVNLGSSLIVHRAQGRSLNMRASFVHLATDAVGSLGAITAGLLVLTLGWQRADPIVSLATAGLVLWAGWGLLRDTTHVLMEGAPRALDSGAVCEAMLQVGQVVDVHHVHLWNLASDVPALSAHLVVTGDPTLRDAERVADDVKTNLADRFALTNVTLELETVPAEEGPTPPQHPTADTAPAGDPPTDRPTALATTHSPTSE